MTTAARDTRDTHPRLDHATFDPLRIRSDFPILQTKLHNKPLVYLDNGATTQKPRQVLDAIRHYYEAENANIHRGVYHLSQLATERWEQTRHKVRNFINAAEDKEIIFTRGTTESINLVANAFSRLSLRAGDEVVVSTIEHHSNIVPWQMACQWSGATLRVIPMNDRGELLLDEYEKILKSGRVKLVSVVHLSNSLGTINDVHKITKLAHAHGAKVLIDGAQWVAHFPTDVCEIDCDFYAFSGHKIFGPTGIGILYGRRELLEAMPPYQGGGDMIASVTFEKTVYADLPSKFEAGTPHIAGAVGLGAAIDYVTAIGLRNTAAHERELLTYATARMSEIPGVRIIGTAANKASVLSFVVDDPPMSSHDIGVVLDMENIAVRTGHHCCQPVMDRLKISSTARASVAMYNTRDDIDRFIDVLKKATAHHQQRTAKSASAPLSSLAFAPPAAVSTHAAAEELAADFEFLPDRDAKNSYVIDLGERIPHAFDLLKTMTERIPGCMSEVYLVGRRAPGKDALEFTADANSDIVRGLIAIMQRLYSGQSATEILTFDIEGFFHRIGLDQFISTQRRNGLAGMIKKIRTLANDVASS
jgi:cysteine desulfurase/selenocysteine lyase